MRARILGWEKMKNADYSFSAFIRINVARCKIDIFEQKSQTLKTFANNKHEISTRIKTLTETDQTIGIMQATVGYVSLLAELLHQHNCGRLRFTTQHHKTQSAIRVQRRRAREPIPQKIQHPCHITQNQNHRKSNSKSFFESVIDLVQDRR